MLEGLEVKEVDYSDVELNKDSRIDTQFWTEKIQHNPNLQYQRIGDCLVKAQYGVSISMNENNIGYPIYRMNEIHNMLCDLEVDKYADLTKDELSIFKLNNKDVLFNRTNSFEWVGKSGIYYKNDLDNRDYVFASYLVRFIPDEKIILPEYLTAFLNSKYGVIDIKRRARQSINQTNVNPEEVKEIKIPLLNKGIQSVIKENFEKAYNNNILSKQKYTQAENLLLETLGLQNFTPSREAVNVKSLKESFLSSGRLDAEYYQPKYEDYIRLIKSSSLGYDNLEKGCNLRDKNYNPKDNIEYNYVELSNIGKSGEITGSTIDLGKELPSRARRLVNTGDVIISSIEGSLESCALVTEQYNKAICSTGFYVINSNKINSETLLVLFKSELMQNILKQNCSGTILTAINKNEFLKIPIPYIENSIQTQIAQLLQESFTLKAESEKLLETAKRAVEIAIEESEEAAIIFVNQNN